MGFMDSLDAILAQRGANSSTFRNSLSSSVEDVMNQSSKNTQAPSAWSAPINSYPSSPATKPADEGGFGSFAGGWDGLIDNPIGRFVGANGLLDTVGHGVQWFEDKTGLSHIGGAEKGATNAWFNSPVPSKEAGNDNPIKALLDAYLGTASNVVDKASQGWKDPNQAAQQGSAMVDHYQMPIVHWLNKMTYGVGTDPLSIAPIEPILGGLTKGISKGASMIPSVRNALDSRIAERAGKVFDENVPVPERPAPSMAPDEAAAENINRWAGVEGDPVPSADRFKVMNPTEQLDYVMGKIKPDVEAMQSNLRENPTPNAYDPNETLIGWNPNKYAQAAANESKVNAASDFMGMSPEDFASKFGTDSRTIGQIAREIDQPRSVPDLATKAAAARGFDLNKLLEGDGFNLSDKMNLDALDRFLGNKAPKVKIGEFPNKKVEPNLPKPEQGVVPFEGEHVAPPGYTAAEWERVQGRKGFINDTVKNYDPAKELRSLTSEKLGNVGKSVSKALNKVGIGSGLEAMPESVRNFVLNNRAEMEAGSGKLDSFFQQMAKMTSDLGVTKNQLREMRDMHETGQVITDPKLKAIRDLLVKATNEGVGGVEAGLKHETTHGIAPETLLDNYLHLSTERPSIVSRILGKGLKGEDRGTITRGYAKERTYKTAAEAEADGHTVRNPINSTYDRLLESNKDISNRKLYKGILELGKKEGFVSKTYEKGMKKFISATDKNPLSGMYVAEPVYRYLKELERVPMAMRDGAIPSALRLYDKAMGVYRNATLYNPMIHNHNTFGNFLVSAGGDMKSFAEAKKVLEGSKDVSKEMEQSYTWAEKTGALGNDAHSDRFNAIDRLLDGKKAQNAFKRFQDKTLWTPEKQLRLGLFHDERMANLKKGLGEAEAANAARDAVNRHLADYTTNNLSKYEKEVMMRLDPYYKWHKSNYPLQMQNMFNPAVMQRRMVAEHVLNATNNSLSGHDQQDNVGDDKEKRKLHAAMGGGNYASIDPYVPWQESNKMLEEPFGNFMWNRVSPLIRTPLLQMLNEKFYPSTSLTPDGGESMANQPIEGKFDTPMEALHKRLTAASDNLLPSYVKNITELLGSPVGRAEDPRNPNIDPRIRMAIGATGAFVNPAPTSQNRVDQKRRIQAKHDIDEKIKYLIGKKRRGE